MANHNRMKAFLKVGKLVSFTLDLPQYLAAIDRTGASVADADAKLTLPKDQVEYAQFWFIKLTPLDDVAFKHLVAGEIDQAEDIWEKRECASSLQNRIVCALMCDNYGSAVKCAEALYGNSLYVKQFVSAIIGESGNVDATQLAFAFLDVLCDEIGANKLLNFITNSTWKKHIGEKYIPTLIDSIQESINIAQKSRGKGSAARLKAGKQLKKDTKDALLQLREFLSTSDLQYQMIADKLGLEILQCGIDYYNGSHAYDAAQNAMSLQKYALDIVVGKMAKDRCQKNFDILQKIIDRLPPAEVFAEDKAINEEINKYCALPDKICHAVTLLNNTKPYLQSIKNKLGGTSAYYLKVSSRVVGNALSNVIAEVNAAQSVDKEESNPALAAIQRIFNVKSVLEEAWEATRIMDGFDMEPDFKRDRYDKNRAILKELCDDLGVSTRYYPPTPQPTPAPNPVPKPRPQPGPTPPFTPPPGPKSDDSGLGFGCTIMLSLIIVAFVLIVFISIISSN